MKCKFCNEKNFTKNGKVRYLQRFLCKSCGKTFVEGDKRGSPMTEARKSIANSDVIVNVKFLLELSQSS
jgi:transposase-like protein